MTELELMGDRNRETDFSTQSHKELSKVRAAYLRKCDHNDEGEAMIGFICSITKLY